jgi:hypothetical protein
LLLFVGLQFMMIGMVADGVIRRIAQHNRPLVPSFGHLDYETGAPGYLATSVQLEKDNLVSGEGK